MKTYLDFDKAFPTIIIGGAIGFGYYTLAAGMFAAMVICILSEIRDKL